MYIKERKAFTMIELIFVILVIGILSAVAIPKFAITKNDAVIAKTKATIAAVKSALATERQKRILQGNFENLDKESIGDNFTSLLGYEVKGCTDSRCEGWETKGTATEPTYTFYGPGGNVVFNLTNNRLVCDTTTSPNHCAKYE